MKINEKQFSDAVRVIANQVNRKILFSLYKDNALKYTNIVQIIVEFKGYKENSGRYAYYIKRLQDRKIITKDEHYYYLTRIGVAVTKIVYGLQKQCMEYDLSDCDADGKIEVLVKRK